MRRLRRFARGEDGQVLYLSIFMLVFLAVFSLVLVNTIILVSTKVRAQNAADQMALSAATLRARVYNKIVNMNGVLYAGVQYFGVASYTRTYASKAIWIFSLVTEIAAIVWGVYEVTEYQKNIESRLSWIAEENGITGDRAEVRVSSADLSFTDFIPDPQQYTVTGYGTFQTMMFDSFDPQPCAVQSRVTWRTSKALIGGRWLGARLPDVVARARAEVRDVLGPLPFMRDWHVFLVQPTDEDDEYLAGGQYAGSGGGAVFSPYPQGGLPNVPTNPNRPSTGRTGGPANLVLPGRAGGGTQGGRNPGQSPGGQESHSPRRGSR